MSGEDFRIAVPQSSNEVVPGAGEPATTCPSAKDRGNRKRYMNEFWFLKVTRLAKQIREKYGPVDNETATRIVQTFRSALVPRKTPGRKPSRAVLIATGMREQNVPWKQIYLVAISGYASMTYGLRSYKMYNLRKAVTPRRGDKKHERIVRPP